VSSQKSEQYSTEEICKYEKRGEREINEKAISTHISEKKEMLIIDEENTV